MNHQKAIEFFRETAAYQRRMAACEPHDDYDKALLEEATFYDAAAEAVTDRNAVLTRLQTLLLEAKSPEVDTPFADGFAAGLGVALKAVGKELEVDAAHISSLHKAEDGPLPEIEAITTTESQDLGTVLDEMAREIIQSNAAAATQKEEGAVENCLRARQNETDYQAALVEQMGLRELKREAGATKGAEAK